MKRKAKASRLDVRVVRLAHGQGLPLPDYQSRGAAGLDLVAAIDRDRPVTLAPGARMLVPTGLVLELPQGYEAQVRPRSGLALDQGVMILNSPGTIDADYRGEVQVLLANLGGAPFEVRRGERVAQLIVQPVVQARFVEVTVVSETKRGAGGFGSTGRGERKKARPTTETANKSKPVPKSRAPAKRAAPLKPPGRR